MQEALKLKSFTTSDLSICTALISFDFDLVSLDKSDSKKVVFSFENSKKLQETINKYWKKELRVEPRQFFENLKSIKSRLYGN